MTRRSSEFMTSNATEDSPWTLDHENILKEWKAKCFINLWLQDASAYYYSKIYNWLSFPVIIISSISSAALFSSKSMIAKYMVAGITMISGVLTSVSRQMKPGEHFQQHMLITRRYHNLIRNIDTVLSLTQNMRPDPSSFLEKISSEIDILMDTQVDPPLHIIRKFESMYGPIERLLYGQDIVQMLKQEIQTSNLFYHIQHKNDELCSEDSTPKEKKQISDYMLIEVPYEK